MRHKQFIAALLAALLAASAGAGTPAPSFADIPAFLKTLPSGENQEAGGVWGELSMAGRRDWASLVHFNTSEGRFRQIVVLSKGDDGRYRLISDTEPELVSGGTGQHFIENIAIAKRSLFIASSWHWHSCWGGATHQYRLAHGEWRLIGAKFHRGAKFPAGDETDSAIDRVEIDANLLTGDVVVKYRPSGGKSEEMHSKEKPKGTLLLKDYSDEDGMPEGYSGYANC
jgi:hypothetical protein